MYCTVVPTSNHMLSSGYSPRSTIHLTYHSRDALLGNEPLILGCYYYPNDSQSTEYNK
ncbi:hypothetical protein HAX54_052379, partial [Datura stramonium]|nr:hypothetical protein [Datura stramonium]